MDQRTPKRQDLELHRWGFQLKAVCTMNQTKDNIIFDSRMRHTQAGHRATRERSSEPQDTGLVSMCPLQPGLCLSRSVLMFVFDSTLPTGGEGAWRSERNCILRVRRGVRETDRVPTSLSASLSRPGWPQPMPASLCATPVPRVYSAWLHIVHGLFPDQALPETQV